MCYHLVYILSIYVHRNNLCPFLCIFSTRVFVLCECVFGGRGGGGGGLVSVCVGGGGGLLSVCVRGGGEEGW